MYGRGAIGSAAYGGIPGRMSAVNPNITLPLTGFGLTLSQGVVAAAVDGNVTVALAGSAFTAFTGSVTAESSAGNDKTVDLSGVGLLLSQGAVVARPFTRSGNNFMVPQTSLRSSLGRVYKQPQEVSDIDLDYTEWFEPRTDAPKVHTVEVAAGLTFEWTARNDKIVKVTVSGGIHRRNYKITVRVTTTTGIIVESDLIVSVREV